MESVVSLQTFEQSVKVPLHQHPGDLGIGTESVPDSVKPMIVDVGERLSKYDSISPEVV